jgi:SagB-type dehydrogenase family enzyme
LAVRGLEPLGSGPDALADGEGRLPLVATPHDGPPGESTALPRADRRTFLRILAGGFALGAGGASRDGSREGVLEIHRATRNTLLGAVGERVPKLESSPSPFKSYPGRGRIDLPPIAGETGLRLTDALTLAAPTIGFQRKPISLAQLARVLFFGNGVTGKVGRGGSLLHLRAAPSAGALYAGEVYVVAEQVRGLAPGLYYYSVIEHELVSLREGSWLGRLARATARPAAIENAATAILLTNVFGRYAWQYANRGYRYALIDSGHIGENLRLAARSAGLAEIAALTFEDDPLNSLLRVDGRREAVCAVHAIGHATDSPGPASTARRSLVEKAEAPGERIPSEGSAPERFHEATKLVPGPATAKLEAPPLLGTPLAGARSALPRLWSPPQATVEETVRQRRSAALFRNAPVRLEELAFALDLAWGAGPQRPGSGPELFVVAHRVETLAPGLYQHRPAERQLAELRSGDLRRAMTRACLWQEKAGAASVGFLMVGRLLEEAHRRGDRSYRDLLIESGEIGQRIYLAAEALGLAARNLSAFLDDDFNQLLGFDGRQRAVLHLTMFGPGE